MKKSEDSLYKLVRSLKKPEKRYFNLRAGLQKGDKQYLRTIAFFDRAQMPEERELISLEGKKASGSWLSMAKKRAFDHILNCLEEIQDDVYATLFKEFTRAEILFSKGLHELAIRELEHMRKNALEYECFQLALLAAEQEYFIRLYSLIGKRKLAGLLEEQRNILEKLNNVKAYYFLSQEIYQYYLVHGSSLGQAERAQARAFRKEELLQNENSALSSEALEYYHLSHTLLYGMEGDHVRSHEHTRKRIQLFWDRPQKIEKAPRTYLQVLNNAMATASYSRQYREQIKYLDKLKEFIARLKHDADRQAAFYLRNHELALHIGNKDWEKALEVATEMEVQIPEFEGMMNEMQKRVLFPYISFIFFNSGEYRKATFWLNKVLQKGGPRIRLDMFCFYSIMYFIAQYEAGAGRPLLYSIYRSAFRYISLKGKMNNYYYIMKKFMKGFLLKEPTKEELIDAFTQLKKDILSIEKKGLTDDFALFFDFKPWIDSRVRRMRGKE